MSKHISTPEECYVFDTQKVGESDLIDPLSVVLSRSIAVLELLQSNGENLKQGFTVGNKTIMDALWQIEADLKQAYELVQHLSTSGGEL